MALAYAIGYKGEIPPLYCYMEKCNDATILFSHKKPLVGLYSSTSEQFHFRDECIDLRGRLGLTQIAFAISKLNALVTSNRDISHIAAAVDTPQVAFVKTSSALKQRPWSRKSQLIQIVDDYHDMKINAQLQNSDNLNRHSYKSEHVVQIVERLLNAFS